ncbi:hypothetical protein AKJ09_06593 [Labilithrix luteola]|uniref:Glycine zipper domain-containing protein n=1 Tax=Labilithrix luteola TaxID=1391654 RepID=A0A0K1Q3I2_9BACT|nr:hypothetical protein [Labilithrix luteola]AKU99929.1 hypothetical protein AKJ09_06593 [Labilithrix luteola]
MASSAVAETSAFVGTEVEDRRRHEHEAEGGIAGALVGVAAGAIAGPPGMIAGAIIGAIVGALAAMALETETVLRAERERELDDTIGVTEGDIGAPNLEHPPPTSGMYSPSSCGVDTWVGGVVAEGPFQPPP